MGAARAMALDDLMIAELIEMVETAEQRVALLEQIVRDHAHCDPKIARLNAKIARLDAQLAVFRHLRDERNKTLRAVARDQARSESQKLKDMRAAIRAARRARRGGV